MFFISAPNYPQLLMVGFVYHKYYRINSLCNTKENHRDGDIYWLDYFKAQSDHLAIPPFNLKHFCL